MTLGARMRYAKKSRIVLLKARGLKVQSLLMQGCNHKTSGGMTMPLVGTNQEKRGNKRPLMRNNVAQRVKVEA